MENNVKFDVLKVDDGFFIKFDENNIEFIAHIFDEEIQDKDILGIMRIVDKSLLGLSTLIPSNEEEQSFEATKIQHKKYRAELCATIAIEIMRLNIGK